MYRDIWREVERNLCMRCIITQPVEFARKLYVDLKEKVKAETEVDAVTEVIQSRNADVVNRISIFDYVYVGKKKIKITEQLENSQNRTGKKMEDKE